MMFRLFLELIRIMALFSILGSFMGALLRLIYKSFGINIDQSTGGWLVSLSIFMLFFLLYRNKLQFSGFYKSSNSVKLSKTMSVLLISGSAFLIIIAPLFAK